MESMNLEITVGDNGEGGRGFDGHSSIRGDGLSFSHETVGDNGESKGRS